MAKPRRKSTPPPKPAASKGKAKPSADKAKRTQKPVPRPKPKAASKAPAARAVKRAPKRPAKGPAKAAARTPAKAAKPVAKVPSRVVPGRSQTPAKPVKPAPPAPPPRRSTYVDALAAYERGIKALQGRKYRDAADMLKSVIDQYPEEKELHERASLYIRFCERQIASAPPQAETPEDLVYAATLALNNGSIDQAVTLLTSAVDRDADNDQAEYMLGVALALKGSHAAAVAHLSRSMALNPENRDMARKEPDLEALRRTDEMGALLASPPPLLPRKDKKLKKARK